MRSFCPLPTLAAPVGRRWGIGLGSSGEAWCDAFALVVESLVSYQRRMRCRQPLRFKGGLLSKGLNCAGVKGDQGVKGFSQCLQRGARLPRYDHNHLLLLLLLLVVIRAAADPAGADPASAACLVSDRALPAQCSSASRSSVRSHDSGVASEAPIKPLRPLHAFAPSLPSAVRKKMRRRSPWRRPILPATRQVASEWWKQHARAIDSRRRLNAQS